MSTDVLVLNKNFTAIQITGWQRAISLLFLDHALVVDQEFSTYDFQDWKKLSKAMSAHPAGFVHTPTFKIAVPEVIALRLYDRLPETEVTFSRRNIYEHYGHKCCYCGRRFSTQELNLEHIVPRSRGGKTDWNNVVTSCIRCNLRKGGRLPTEAGMRLLIRPSRPRWRHRVFLMRSPVKVRASWQRFIDAAYWDSELEQ